jgi:hypothetical protein
MNIGEEIKYVNEYGENIVGTIKGVFSDMDSYDEMKLENGLSYYVSKKLTAKANKNAKKNANPSIVFAPVKAKNLDSVFLEVMPINNPKGYPDYIPITSLENNVNLT